jgi:hypothetical protein
LILLDIILLILEKNDMVLFLKRQKMDRGRDSNEEL